MKKAFITILALISFGFASSAHAFFDPLATPATAICGVLLVGLNTTKNKVDDQKVECTKVQDQKLDQPHKQVKKSSDNALTSPHLVPIVNVNLPIFD